MSKNFELMLRSASGEFLRGLTDERPDAPTPRRPRLDACDDTEIIPFVRNVFLAQDSRHVPRSVVFTSAEASGQSADVCVRAAKALASFDTGTVCIVDANLSCPSMHRTFLVPQEPGVADVLELGHGCRLAAREIEPGLWFLPAGHMRIGSHGDITPDRVKAMMAELSESFDWVLADIGPLGPAGGTSAIAQSADGVVLVVAANATKRAVVLKAKQDLVAAGGCLLGAVFTDRTFPIPEAIYRRL